MPCMKPGIARIKKKAAPQKVAIDYNFICVTFKKYYLNSLKSGRQVTCKQFQPYLRLKEYPYFHLIQTNTKGMLLLRIQLNGNSS